MAKKVLIIGAGFLQSFVIKKAHDLGYYVIAVDGDENALGFQFADQTAVINITDVDSCFNFARCLDLDGVLTAATDYGVLTAAYIANKLNLPGIDYDVAKIIKNKYLVRKKLFESHVDDTEQAYEISTIDEIEKIKSSLVYPVMVKPCDGSGSRGASKVCHQGELLDSCLLAMSSSSTKKALIESFIVGKEYGAESIVLNGEVYVLGVMQKWMTNPPYYAELGHALPNDLNLELNTKIIKCVTDAIKALKISFGSVNMDLLVTKEGSVHIVDVGARMGGNMIGPCVIPIGTGIDYVELLLRSAVSDYAPLKYNQHQCVCTRIIAFDNNCLINILPDFNSIERKYNVSIYHHMKIGDEIHQYHTNLDGCGYIVSKSDNLDEAISNANEALNYIKDFYKRNTL